MGSATIGRSYSTVASAGWTSGSLAGSTTVSVSGSEMEKLGVTRRSLDASWDDLHDAVKHRDPEAFSRSLVTLQTTLERHEPPPTSTRTGTARSAGQRIQRLSDFTERWSRERAEALSDMQSTAAELAITLGLSDPPSVP